MKNMIARNVDHKGFWFRVKIQYHEPLFVVHVGQKQMVESPRDGRNQGLVHIRSLITEDC
jgi:hypothetical protein